MSIHQLAKPLAPAVLLLAWSVNGHTVPVFSDNFDAEPLGLNSVPSQWTVSNGTVDIIGPGLFDLLPGNGNYIDLDGSTGNAGVLTSLPLTLNPGVNSTLLFDLAGSQRGDTNTVRAGMDFNADSFFDVFVDITLPSGAPFAQFSIPFTVAALTNNASIVFDHQGGDNLGLLLDDVILDAAAIGVPEPGVLGLIGAGLLAGGFAARRRNRSV